MKKALGIVLATMMLLLVGCGGGEEPAKSTTTAEAATTITQKAEVTPTPEETKDEATLVVAAPVDVPMDVSIGQIAVNSAGTPEAEVLVTNTGDKTIEVFNVWIRCYDAYGDRIKGYNRYNQADGTYDDPLAPGESTPSGMYFSLYGFDNTKTIEVAVSKYKLEGEETVELKESQMSWVTME